MRTFIFITFLFALSSANAQTFFPGSFIDYGYRGNYANSFRSTDSISSAKKWSVSKYAGVSTGISVFNGGSATFVSVPVGLQFNRKLTNNLYAFAGVSVAPSYVNFRQSFLNADGSKGNTNNLFFNSRNPAIYSRAELGLMYVNDEKTFSISGSIGIERSNYSMPVYGPVGNSNSKNYQIRR